MNKTPLSKLSKNIRFILTFVVLMFAGRYLAVELAANGPSFSYIVVILSSATIAIWVIWGLRGVSNKTSEPVQKEKEPYTAVRPRLEILLDKLDFVFCPVCGAVVPKTAKQCLVCKPASDAILNNSQNGQPI